MIRKIMTLFTAVMMAAAILPLSVKAEEEYGINEYGQDDTAYTVSLKLTDAVQEYLNEIYIEKNPEFGLRMRYGLQDDWAQMKSLGDQIIQRSGAKTDEEITAAFIGWTRANIDYDVYSALPMDVLSASKGDCLSYAILISQMLRLQGIRSVAVDGYRADMRLMKQGELREKLWGYGHAWIYVYLNGEWTMFDPLWSADEPIIDREFIATWYFPDTIEGVTMTYEGNRVSFSGFDIICIYENGRFMCYAQGEPWSGNSSYLLNNLDLSYTSYGGEGDGYFFTDAPGAVDDMVLGQVYSQGRWLSTPDGDRYMYCYENGMHPFATAMEKDGITYYCDGGYLEPLHKDVTDFWIERGLLTLPVGFKGYVYGEPSVHHGAEEDWIRTWTFSKWNENKNVVLREDGYIEINGPGYIELEYTDVSSVDGRTSGGGLRDFWASNGKPAYHFTFRQWDLSESCWYEMEEGPYFYNGKPVTPKITVYEPQILDSSIGKPLREGIDYTITYQNNNAPGKAAAIIKGKGNYKGEMRAQFTIEKQPVLPSSLDIRESSVEIISGKPYQLNVTIQPANADKNALRWTSADENIAIVDGDGKVTGRNYGTTTITVTSLNGLTDSVTVNVLFKDVADGSRYFYTPVYWAAENGITVGAGGVGKFSPDASCTREQFVTFLWRLNKEPEPENDCEFSDVNKTDWYYKPIAWAYENNITTGLNDGTGRFGVGLPCTREQCVTFLYRSADQPSFESSLSFTDVEEGRYFFKAIRWAASEGITVGLNDGTGRFGVGQECTRGMLVTFLHRFAVPPKG